MLHGDLSLDNVIFSEKGPIFIDWEHFQENAAPLGFDSLYLLFESLWFESRNNNLERHSLSHLVKRFNSCKIGDVLIKFF